MAEYLDLPISTDPQDVLDDFVTYMQGVVPGWTPNVPNLDTWLAMAFALNAAETRDVASAVPKSIFRFFGATLLGYPPLDAIAATVLTDWTMQDNAGYTIPAGTQVSIAQSGDQVYAFETLADVIVSPGSTTAIGVQINAVTPGVASSGLGSIGGAVQLIDPLAFVTTITQETVTNSGQDAEDDDTYLNRLVSYLQTIAPRPILPADFAVFARAISGVYRAVAIDGYNPGDGTFFNDRMVAIAAVDINGNPVDGSHKAAIDADLQGRREINFVVNVIDPTTNLIDVTYQVKALAGYDPTALLASINAALTAYLSPAVWGSTSGDPSLWTNQTNVRYLEIASVINAVPGVDYITTTGGNYDLQTGIHSGVLARADVVLTGVAPLTRANVLTGTIT